MGTHNEFNFNVDLDHFSYDKLYYDCRLLVEKCLLKCLLSIKGIVKEKRKCYIP